MTLALIVFSSVLAAMYGPRLIACIFSCLDDLHERELDRKMEKLKADRYAERYHARKNRNRS